MGSLLRSMNNAVSGVALYGVLQVLNGVGVCFDTLWAMCSGTITPIKLELKGTPRLTSR